MFEVICGGIIRDMKSDDEKVVQLANSAGTGHAKPAVVQSIVKLKIKNTSFYWALIKNFTRTYISCSKNHLQSVNHLHVVLNKKLLVLKAHQTTFILFSVHYRSFHLCCFSYGNFIVICFGDKEPPHFLSRIHNKAPKIASRGQRADLYRSEVSVESW